MLYRREDGVFRCSYVPLEDRERVERLTRHYRNHSQARTALAKLGKRSLELADALQEALLEPYPAPGRRGTARSTGPAQKGSKRRPR